MLLQASLLLASESANIIKKEAAMEVA